jgi:hypothetical protein
MVGGWTKEMGFQMSFEDSDGRGRSNFDRDVTPYPRSTVTESAFAKLSFASGNGKKILAGRAQGKTGA